MNIKNMLTQMLSMINISSEYPLIIWGAGIRGRRFLYYLNNINIKVECFGDNSPDKAGECIDGIPCYSLQSIKEKYRGGESMHSIKSRK